MGRRNKTQQDQTDSAPAGEEIERSPEFWQAITDGVLGALDAQIEMAGNALSKFERDESVAKDRAGTVATAPTTNGCNAESEI